MQTIKEKLSDMSAMRQAKAEAREEEKAQAELGKARIQVAHEVRMAREAEAAMDLHISKAANKAAEVEHKYPQLSTQKAGGQDSNYDTQSPTLLPDESGTQMHHR